MTMDLSMMPFQPMRDRLRLYHLKHHRHTLRLLGALVSTWSPMADALVFFQLGKYHCRSQMVLMIREVYREETHAATSGFSHCRYARYNSQQEAETAWQLALESGCVGPPDLGTAALATESHPISSDSVRISTEAETFWVVLRGRRPGVYIGR